MNFFEYLFSCIVLVFSIVFGNGSKNNSWVDFLVGFICILLLAGFLVLIGFLCDFIYKKIMNKKNKSVKSKKNSKNNYLQEPININTKPLSSLSFKDKKNDTDSNDYTGL